MIRYKNHLKNIKSSNIWKAERYIWSNIFFREGLAYFSRTELNHILHLFQQLRSRRVQLLHWPAAVQMFQRVQLLHWPAAVQMFHHLKTFKYNKEEPGILYQTWTGQRSSARGPAAGLLSSRCLQMLLKEEGMLHMELSQLNQIQDELICYIKQ